MDSRRKPAAPAYSRQIEIQLRPAAKEPVEQVRLLFVQAHQIFGANTEPKGFLLQALVVKHLKIERFSNQSGNAKPPAANST